MLTPMSVSSTATSLDPLTLEQLPPDIRQRLLRFPLGQRDSALLPLEQIAEILKLSVADILPVPEMPSCVLGICNWRGEMLWLIDLNHLVGYSPVSWVSGVSPAVMVVQVDNQSVGLVVQHVNDIELHDLLQLQPTAIGLFPPRLLPFILGALPGDNGTVLDATAIMRSPLWKIHQKGVS